MSGKFYVYALFRRDGSPFYIGKGCRRRLNQHLGAPKLKTRLRNSHKDAIVAQIISQGLDVPRSIIRDSLSEEDAFAVEISLIAAIGRHPNGPLVNLTDGGEGWSGRKLSDAHRAAFTMSGRKHSAESRLRMSEVSKGKPGTRLDRKNSPEHTAAISQALKARGYQKRKPLSEATKQKLAAIFKGRVSEAAVAAARISNTGRTASEETRAKLREASKGNKSAAGSRRSEAHRAAVAEAQRGNQHTKGRKLTLEEIEKRTASRRANYTPERAAAHGSARRGIKQKPEYVAKRVAARKASKEKRLSEHALEHAKSSDDPGE